MIIIGEKINGTRPKVKEAIANRDGDFIKGLAKRQVDAGADYLDVNAGTALDREPEDMIWLINLVQEVSEVPVCIDSANYKAIEAGISAVNKAPILNSLSGETNRIVSVLPLACEHQTELIVLAMDDKGIPGTVAERMDIVRNLVSLTREGGLQDQKLYIDPLITAAATDITSGSIAFEAMRSIKREFPEVHLTGGLSNISFGLPARSVVNQAFAVLAIEAGLDSAIMDPENSDLRSIIYAVELVLGRDKFCAGFTKAFRAGKIG